MKTPLIRSCLETRIECVGRRSIYLVRALISVATGLGFRRSYVAGEVPGGRQITSQIHSLVILDGVAMTARMVRFLARTVLIRTRNRILHARVGWPIVAVAVWIVLTGIATATGQPALRLAFLPMACNTGSFNYSC